MHVVIIGNGIAGITAARTIRELSDHAVTVISEEAPFHFSRPAMMYLSMRQLSLEHVQPYSARDFKKLDIVMLHDRVVAIDVSSKRCDLYAGGAIHPDVIVLATGSEPTLYDVPSRTDPTVITYTQLSDVARLDEEASKARKIAVVGGGLVGVEVAEILHARGVPFVWHVREEGVYGSHLPHQESELITQHIRSFGVDVRLGSSLNGLAGEVDTDLVVMCTGVRPRTSLARSSGIECLDGIIVSDEFATSIPGIYAIGDCAQPPWGVEQRWHSGRQHGWHVAHVIAGNATSFQRPVFTNGAKFFDLEWQVVGTVPSDGARTFYWKDRELDRCVRVAHDDQGRVCGIHAIGVRLRQTVCEQWIDQGASVDQVRSCFHDAVFDPSFEREVTL